MAKPSKSGVRGLFRGGDGRWRIDLRWKDPSTGQSRRHCELLPSGMTAGAAKLRARRVMEAALSGTLEENQQPRVKLAAALKEYVTWCEANRPLAAKRRKALSERLLAFFGDVELETLSPFDVERFKRQRLQGETAPATVNRDLEVLHHFFGLAASWGWVSEQHAATVRKVPHLKEPPGRVRYLTDDEEGRLMGALPTLARKVVCAALLSGMRQSEVAALRKEAVDLEAKLITLTKTKANKVRHVYINAPLAELLRNSMAASSSPFVFVSRKGKPYTGNGIRSIFRRAVAKANIENFHFHDTRHTTATRLRRRGVGLDAIAEVLGHSTLAMARRYTHLGAETLRQAMDTLPPPIPPTVPIEDAPQERPTTTAKTPGHGRASVPEDQAGHPHRDLPART